MAITQTIALSKSYLQGTAPAVERLIADAAPRRTT
jgi:hypothetical protein